MFLLHLSVSATFPVNYTVRGDSFTLQATENVVVDELFLIKVVAFDKTKPNENLHVLRFTFVDNDGKSAQVVMSMIHLR